MKAVSLTLFCCSLILLSATLAAQPDRLNEKQLQDFRDQAQQKLESIKLFFIKIGSKDTDNQIKNMYITQSNKLFKSESIIQVSSKNGGLTNYTVLEYLDHLKTYSYQVVIIEYIAEGAYFSEFKEVVENGKTKYVATAKVVQRFCGYLNAIQASEFGDCDYEDTTEKQIEVVLERISTYDNENHWVVKLGDITVLRTI